MTIKGSFRTPVFCGLQPSLTPTHRIRHEGAAVYLQLIGNCVVQISQGVVPRLAKDKAILIVCQFAFRQNPACLIYFKSAVGGEPRWVWPTIFPITVGLAPLLLSKSQRTPLQRAGYILLKMSAANKNISLIRFVFHRKNRSGESTVNFQSRLQIKYTSFSSRLQNHKLKVNDVNQPALQ